MRSSTLGASTSEAEVTCIDRFGIWLLVRGSEFFLPYEQYPWFKNAPVSDVLAVKLLHKEHLHWPALDVDLHVDSLKAPDEYPLTYK